MAFKADTGQSLVLSAPASGTVTLQAGGSDAMFIDASQNVSIGNTNPQTPFHVTGNVRIDGDLDVNGTTTTIDTETQLTDQLIITNAGTGPAIEANQTGAQPVVDFQDDGVSAFYIENGGNVGINMTDPVYKLDVRRTSLNGAGLAGVASLRTDAKTASDGITLSFNALDSLDNDTEYAAIGVEIVDPVNASEDGDIVFRNIAAGSVGERMRIESTGNVGIGTDSPGERLDVRNGGLGVGNGTIKTVISYNTRGVLGTTSNHDLEIRTNNTEQMRLTADGRLGIGTTGPTTSVLEAHNNEDNAYVAKFVQDHATGWGVLIDVDGTLVNDPALWVKTATENILWCGSNGDVGIGTTAPGAELHVYRNGANAEINVERGTGANVRIQAQASAGQVGTATNSNFQLITNSTARMTIENSGNVGIGTTDPSELLEVDGNIRLGDGGTRDIIGPTNESLRIISSPNATTEGIIFSTDGGTTAEMSLLDGGVFALGTAVPPAGFKMTVRGDADTHAKMSVRADTPTSGAYDAVLDLTGRSASIYNNCEIRSAGSASNGGIMTFWTDNSSGVITERMEIDASGDVTIHNDLTVTGSITGTLNATGIVNGTSEVDIATANGEITFDTAGSERMVIDTSGNVGIGVLSPGAKLEVSNSGGAGDDFVLKNSNVNYERINISAKLTADTNESLVRLTSTREADGSSAFTVETGTGGSASERFRIDPDGNVGIGTTDPAAGGPGGKVLHVVNSGATASVRVERSDAATAGTLYITSGNSTNGLFSSGAKDLTISTNSAERVRIDQSGNVGIGVTDPGAALEINGKLLFNSAVNAQINNANSVRINIDSDDSGTGEYFAVGHNQDGIDGNDELFRVGENGRFGIGTNNPQVRFHVEEAKTFVAGNNGGVAKFENTTTGEPCAILLEAVADNAGAGNHGAIWFDAGADGTTADNRLVLSAQIQDNTTAPFVITGDGHVGIGETDPANPLHIKELSSTACRLILENTGTSSPTNNQIWSQNNDIVLRANGLDGLRLNSNRELSTGGEEGPDVDPGGICVNHGANDGNAMTFKNSDIAHDITTVAETDTYGILKKSATTTGGFLIRGLTEDIRALELTAVGTNASTSDTGSGTIVFDSNKKSGTGQTSLASTENIISIQNNTVAKIVIKGNGDIRTQAGITTGGESSPDVDAGGITIHHGTSDGNAFTIKNGDVAHGMTGSAETDTYFKIKKASDGPGGAELHGYGETTYGLLAWGSATTATTSATGQGPLLLRGTKKSGGVEDTSVADGEVAISFQNEATTKMAMFGNGDLITQGGISTGGEASPNVDPGGICIYHGANDGNAFSIKNSDVAHPFTTHSEADTYAEFRKGSSTGGGLVIDGFSETNNAAFKVAGYRQTPATSDTAGGIISLDGYKSDGSTSVTAVADGENLLVIRNQTTTKVAIKGNGDIRTQAGISTGGESSPDVDAGGICINHGASDGHAFSVKNSDVSHPFSAQAETDTYLEIEKTSATQGGARLTGYREGSGSAVQIRGYRETLATGDTAAGVVQINALKSNGTTGATSCADGEVMFSVANNGTNNLVVKGNGDLASQGSRMTLGGVDWIVGSGSPESSVTANVGSIYSRTDGGSGTTMYVKESGTGNTGWVAK